MKKIIITSLLISLLIPTASAHAAAKSLNTKGNKASCKSIKTNYESGMMSKWSNGLASDQDVLKEIDLNINMLTAKQKSTTGKIKTTIASWIKAEKDTKNALSDKNVEGITAAMNLKISSITNFDKLCKGIEK
jgi:DNA-directed RNA polymerase specialized sigma54-like protein